LHLCRRKIFFAARSEMLPVALGVFTWAWRAADFDDGVT